MKRLARAIALTILLAFSATAIAGNGNGAPSGPHYNLNIIGVDKGKKAEIDRKSVV